jgi:hypothetical protein
MYALSVDAAIPESAVALAAATVLAPAWYQQFCR